MFDLDRLYEHPALGADVPVAKANTFIAKSEDEQFVLGPVLVPDTEDLQGDVVSADEIRQAAHRFMEWYQDIHLQHERDTTLKVTESFVAPVDFQLGDYLVKAGTWLLGVHVTDPGIWQMVKDGRLRGFSIGGYAERVPVEDNQVPENSPA